MDTEASKIEHDLNKEPPQPADPHGLLHLKRLRECIIVGSEAEDEETGQERPPRGLGRISMMVTKSISFLKGRP